MPVRLVSGFQGHQNDSGVPMVAYLNPYKLLVLGMTGRHGELCGGEERRNKVGLVGQMLANAFLQRDDTALQLNDTKGNTIDIYHNIGA